MDSNLPSPPHDNSDAKKAFRKPSGDAAGRNYRRRSPAEGSPPPDGSPKHEHRSSPNPLSDDSIRVSDHHSRKYDGREPDRQYCKSHYGRSSNTYRHSDRQSSRSSYGHSRHYEYADEDRFRGHESRGDHTREENDSRLKDSQHTPDKYSRDRYDRLDYKSKERDGETYLEYQKHKDKGSLYDRSGSGRRHALYDDLEREKYTRDRDGRDEKRDYRRSFGDHRSDQTRLKESYKNEQKELDGQNLTWEERRKYDGAEIGKDKDQSTRKVGDRFSNECRESSGKKPKLFVADRDENNDKDDKRRTSKFSHESKADSKVSKTSGFDVGNDLDAAKVAAVKAAELVNKNLVGVGCLTTDQKKKLLWGKKSTTIEESGHRWDTTMFADRERQEKFNKLMGVKGEAKLEQNSDNLNGNDLLRVEKQRDQLQEDLEKQYTAGLRRRDGRTVGLGL